MTEQPTISDELRVTLMQVWLLGFLEYVAGGEVTDQDQITTQFADQLIEMATWAIDAVAPKMAGLILENPAACHKAMYLAGRKTAEDNTIPSPPISLN